MSKNIYFLCAPNMGVLDSWLPVLFRLKEYNFHFVCIIPKAGVASSIDTENILSKVADSIFNKVIFKTYSDDWSSADSFFEAKNFNSLTVFEIFLLRLDGLSKKYKNLLPVLSLLKSLLKFTNRIRYTNKYCKLDLDCDNSALLYDLDEEFKEYNKEVMSLLKSTRKFSLAHGFGNIGLKEADFHKKNKDFVFTTKVFTYTDLSRDYYLSYHSINSKNIKLVGVPKFEKWWMDYLISNSSPIDDENYVFLISRPASAFLPKESKKKIIADIKQFVIDNMGLKLIIKKHPKEIIGDNFFENILGLENYGNTWEYSNQHPFSIGKKCLFSISFYSGVVVDMLAMGVPAIEYINLKDLPEFDNNFSLRIRGEPVFNFRYCGLTLGASNSLEFKKCLDEVVNNREKVLEHLTASFKDLSLCNERSTNLICAEIVTGVSNNEGSKKNCGD